MTNQSSTFKWMIFKPIIIQSSFNTTLCKMVQKHHNKANEAYCYYIHDTKTDTKEFILDANEAIKKYISIIETKDLEDNPY